VIVLGASLLFIPEKTKAILFNFMGIVILLSGILHILGGLQVGGKAMQGRTTLAIMLGILEVFLGGVFIIFQGGQSQIMYGIAIGWALIGGVLLLRDAYRQYRASTVNR
jgi:uncharacterized membrane protein HdeD (DUF308 family)